jgi:hypothetical protein
MPRRLRVSAFFDFSLNKNIFHTNAESLASTVFYEFFLLKLSTEAGFK